MIRVLTSDTLTHMTPPGIIKPQLVSSYQRSETTGSLLNDFQDVPNDFFLCSLHVPKSPRIQFRDWSPMKEPENNSMLAADQKTCQCYDLLVLGSSGPSSSSVSPGAVSDKDTVYCTICSFLKQSILVWWIFKTSWVFTSLAASALIVICSLAWVVTSISVCLGC